MIFRELSEKEEKEFRQWARDNYQDAMKKENYKVLFHPVVVDELDNLSKSGMK